MTYDEFIESDKYNAFSGWLSVKNAKQIGFIPEKYWPYFKDNCECGSANIITHSLTQEMCCDPMCYIKQPFKLANLFKQFQLTGVGERTCANVYNTLKMYDERYKENGDEPLFVTNSCYEVLAIPWDKYPTALSDVASMNFCSACMKVKQASVTYPQLIANMGLPSISNEAKKLFSGLNSFQELKEEIQRLGNIQNFCISRGFMAPVYAYNLATFIEDIAVISSICGNSVRAEGLNKLDVCITGVIKLHGVKMTKAAFITECNKLCISETGVQLLEIAIGTAVQSAPFIIYSTKSSSAKFTAGLNRGQVTDAFGTHDVLITADEFYATLERMMKTWNQQIRDLNSNSESQMTSTTQTNSTQAESKTDLAPKTLESLNQF